jgi:hypothetical protein
MEGERFVERIGVDVVGWVCGMFSVAGEGVGSWGV